MSLTSWIKTHSAAVDLIRLNGGQIPQGPAAHQLSLPGTGDMASLGETENLITMASGYMLNQRMVSESPLDPLDLLWR